MKDVDEIKRRLRLLFEENKGALEQIGTGPNPMPKSKEISDLMDWILKEFHALADVFLVASDFAAVFLVGSLLKLLCNFDCADLPKFRGALSKCPNAASTSAIRPNEEVRAVKVKFTRELWFAREKRLREEDCS